MKHFFYLGSSPDGFHKIHVIQAGRLQKNSQPPVVCVHGLARNCYDFEELANELSAQNRCAVFAPDLPGRGKSDWLDNHARYCFEQYISDLTALIAKIGVDQVDWVGSSMGGLIGMVIASMHGSPIRRLVLNDVGPLLNAKPLKRIGGYMKVAAPAFKNFHDLEFFIRKIYAGFGALTDRQWHRMAKTSARPLEDGTWVLAYDPAVAGGAALYEQPIDMWDIYDRVTCPVLVLRGENSDILPPDVALEMTRRGPKAELVTIPDTAHHPALKTPEQIEVIRNFFAKGSCDE